jgi:hypothetical protein
MSIKFLRVLPGTKEWDRLVTFAESFDQKLNPARATMVAVDGDTWIGCVQLIQTPIVLTAIHPESGKGRAAIEMIKALNAWSDIQFGETLTGVNEQSIFMPLMERIGFKDLNLKLFKGN